MSLLMGSGQAHHATRSTRNFTRWVRRVAVIAVVLLVGGAAFLASSRADVVNATTPRPHSYPYVMIGASVTYVARSDIQAALPGLYLDARNGRGWANPPSGGGTNVWQAFVADAKYVKPGGWIIIEAGLGGVNPDVFDWYVKRVVAAMPRNVCLAWVMPHTYFAGQTSEQTALRQKWNADVQAFIRTDLAAVRCHSFVEWDAAVVTATQRTPHLTTTQIDQSQPLCYDGRHPTATGSLVLAELLQQGVRRAT